MFVSVTVTLVTGSTKPATLIVDGYGAAGPNLFPVPGIMTGVVLENVDAEPVVGVTVIVATTGALVPFVAVNDAILPVPPAARPIDGSLLVQL